MALDDYVIKLGMVETQKAVRLLANATNNINQNAKRTNDSRSIYTNDIIQLREEIGNLKAHVKDVVKLDGKLRVFF